MKDFPELKQNKSDHGGQRGNILSFIDFGLLENSKMKKKENDEAMSLKLIKKTGKR